LNNGGDTVTLLDGSGAQVDSFRYSSSSRGSSWMRIPDGCTWSTKLQSKPTKGFANPSGVLINEVMPDPASGKEWVEIYNPSSCVVNTSGWKLKDKAGYMGSWTESTISAGSYTLVEFSNKLNNGGDTLTLLGSKNQHVDSYEYASSFDGKSWMRMPDAGSWNNELATPTKLSPNPPASPAARGCGGCHDGLCFGTWNIQNLGVSKGGRPAVINAIQRVVQRYDLIAVQELSQKPVPPFECGDNTESVICSILPDKKAFTVTVRCNRSEFSSSHFQLRPHISRCCESPFETTARF